jgi:hypothetical protein
VSIDDERLVELLHRGIDAWAPSADPDELARQFNENHAHRRRWQPPVVTARAVRIAVTLCVLATAVAVPLALGGHGGSAPAGPLSGRAVPLPADFYGAAYGAASDMAMSCSGSVCVVTGSVHQHGQSVPAYVEITNGVPGQPKVIPGNVTNGVQIDHISCSSPSNCVGASAAFMGPGGAEIDFARFDGTAWHGLPRPPGVSRLIPSMDNNNDGVNLSCLPGGNCLVVVDASAQPRPPLSYQISGEHWTVLPSFPKFAKSYGYSVEDLACVGPADCYAAGTRYAKVSARKLCFRIDHVDGRRVPVHYFCRGNVTQSDAVVMHWDGHNWGLVGFPPPPGFASAKVPPSQAEFEASLVNIPEISCVGSGACYMIEWELGGLPQAVEELRNGAWSRALQPRRPPQPEGIDCTSAGYCVATGESGYPHLGGVQVVWSLNNGIWSKSVIDLPASNYLAVFGDASCPETGRCYELYSTNTYKPYAPGTSYVLEMTQQAG